MPRPTYPVPGTSLARLRITIPPLHSDHPLWWTIPSGGPSSGGPSSLVDYPLWWISYLVDYPLWWTIYSGGPSSLVDHPLWWTFLSVGKFPLVAHPIWWTIISGGPSSLVNDLGGTNYRHQSGLTSNSLPLTWRLRTDSNRLPLLSCTYSFPPL
ncbi:hypothetical protein J6590_096257 [Homalodisca vitripennis]|nr:hypothetical protein J6590_096257 [Homalodisca vitripennis]